MESRDVTSLIEGAPRIWGAVAQHTQRITHSYQRALLESARQFEDQRRDWFTRLLQSGGRANDVVESAAHVLDFDIEGRFIVVLADRKDGADLRAAREGVRTFGWGHHQQEIDEGDLLVVECAPENDPKLLRWLHRTRCGIAPAAHGLSQVPAAVKLASSTLAALPAEHRAPGHLKDVWMSIAVAHAPTLSAAIAHEVLAPLEGVPEATKLLETAREYCYGDGTVASVAQKLFCHRNTVLNRLERFRQLTGHDVRVPHEAALVLLAITTAGRQSPPAANPSPR
jgi:sugar diacid utilization regulator